MDAVNDPPVANDDVVTGQEDQAVTFDPRTNDSDPEGQALTITEINGTPITVGGTPVDIFDPATGDKIGEISLNPSGTLTFTPEPNFNTSAPIPIQYTVQDPDGEPATATINLTILPVNDDPVATDDYRMVTERWRNAEGRILREFIRRGDLPPIDVDLAARQLVGLSVGPFMDEQMSGHDQDGPEPSPQLVERVRTAVEQFVRGLQASPR